MIKITSKTEFFDELKSSVPVVADFTAAWCAPCKMQTPVLAEFEKNLGGKVKVICVDVDENAELADELGIKAIPTLLIYKDGTLIDKTTGLNGLAALSEKLIAYV